MDNQFLNFGKPPISMGGLFFYLIFFVCKKTANQYITRIFIFNYVVFFQIFSY